MGVNYKEVPVKKNSEVVHPGHPAIIDTGLLADKTKKYKAGTILKADADGKLSAAAAADTPVAVLTQDSDGENAEVMVMWHGMAVQGRLLDSSGASPVAPTAAMAAKLRPAIFPIQPWAKIDKR
ncbi:MAG: hypothetical protein LBI04_00845 [Treponema sp.]|jgi:hypothetical protein|nr:hypothetical protein [Treponema sp.]